MIGRARVAAVMAGSVGLLWSIACEPAARSPDDSTSIATASLETPLGQAALAIDSLSGLGDAAYAEAGFEDASVVWRKALILARSAHDTAREAHLLTSLGLAAFRSGDLRGSRALGEKAVALKVRAGLDAALFRSYNALGLLAFDEGRLRDAMELYQKAAAAAGAQNDSASLAKAINNIALTQFEIGNYGLARAGFLEARRLGRKVGDARTEGRALSNLARHGLQLGDPQAALSALVEARALLQADADHAGEQNALGQMGVAYDALGEPRLALAAMDSALVLSRRYGLRQEEADNLEVIASLHRQAGDLQRALDLYLQANRINEAIGQKVEEGTNLRQVAEIHAVLGRPDLARQKASEGLDIHRAAGLRLEELRDVLLLADLESAAGGSVASATAHLRTADRLSEALDARVARVEVALVKATIADRRGDSRAVLHVLQGARTDLARGGFGGEWQAAALRSRAYARLTLLDSAAIAGQTAVAALERVRSEYGSAILRSAFTADKAAPYADLVDILLRLGRTADAFEVADRARSHALVEHLSATDAGGSFPTIRGLSESEGLLRHIDALIVRRDSLEAHAPAERDGAARDRARTLATELAQARDAYETLLIRIGEADAAGSALLGGRTATAAEVRRALMPDEAMLEYLITPSRVITFVITTTAVRSLVTETSREDLARWVRLAREMLGSSRRALDGETEAVEALHAALIEPAERAGLLANARRLIIVPHSVLGYLPFAALRRNSSSRFLMQDYTLLHLPTATALVIVRGPSNATTSAPARVFAPFPRELPGSVREARAFTSTVAESHAAVGLGATEAAFRSALAGGGIVHLATHGIMNPRNPMFSRLELSTSGTRTLEDDGRLEMHEVLGLRIAASLVFLSGCETGVGAAWSTQFARGEDYATLAQAFLFAGARTVVATLWPIGDEGAAAFAERFYFHLRTAPPADALAAAQRDLLRGSRHAAPFYWAGYQVIGNNKELPVSHSPASLSVSRMYVP